MPPLKRPKKSALLPDLLARARELAPKLGSATDELNAAFERAESALRSLKLGVTASVTLEESRDEDDGTEWLRLLTFGKEGASWKLLVENGVCGDPETWTTRPLVNASRETRLLAAEHLPQLLEQLIAEAEKEIEQVRKHAGAVEDMVSSIQAVVDSK